MEQLGLTPESPLSSTSGLPSLSPLTGTVRPSTAATFLEASIKSLTRKPRREWGVAQSMPGGLVKGITELGDLKQAASKQLTHIQRAPMTPYARHLTPKEQADKDGRVVKQLQQLASAIQEVQQRLKTAEAGEVGEGFADGLIKALSKPGTPMRPMTPAQVMAVFRDTLPDRPATSMSVNELTLGRPSSRFTKTLQNLAEGDYSQGWPQGPGMAGTSGRPYTSGSEMGGMPRSPLLRTPGGSPRTPQWLHSRSSQLRASAPAHFAALSGGQGGAGSGAEVWVNPSALEPVSKEQRERLLLASSMGNRAAADQTGTASTSAAAAGATARLLATQAITPGGLPSDSQAVAALARARTPGGASPDSIAPAQLERPALGAPGNPRWGPGQPLEQFVPTRGLIYSVFAELDHEDKGKLTYSEFEDAAVIVGLRQDQARVFYNMLDKDAKGYFTVKEWGGRATEKQVAEFTRLYIQSTRGATGKPANVKEVRSAALALQIAMSRLQIKNHGRIVRPERVLRAFEFIDADGSGSLSAAEMRDAFMGMGIYVTNEVLDEIVQKFDANGNGTIEYNEFIGTLFPILSRGLRVGE